MKSKGIKKPGISTGLRSSAVVHSGFTSPSAPFALARGRREQTHFLRVVFLPPYPVPSGSQLGVKLCEK